MAQAIAGCDCNTYIIHSAVENTRGAAQLRRAQKRTLHDFPRKKVLHSRKRRRGFLQFISNFITIGANAAEKFFETHAAAKSGKGKTAMPCTTLLVGKKATYDGSTLMARNEDSGAGQFTPKKFIVVKPEEQPRHYRSVISGVEIDLPDDPMQYTAMPNALPDEGIWGEAGINACNVAMSETETLTSNPRVLGADPLVKGGIGEEDMLTLVLPYIHSAREGVLRLGSLIEQYGTYEMNGIGFQDVNEIWWFESIGGHHWMAKRVPDDAYVVMPNQQGIDRFDFLDAFGAQNANLCAEDLADFVRQHHLDVSMRSEDPASQMDFDARGAFGSRSDSDHSYNTPRAWFMLRYLNPRTHLWEGPQAEYTPESDDLPWSMVPERKVTVEDVKYVLSSYYQGTDYNPYNRHGDPAKRGMYRPIGINRNNFVAITQLRPDVPAALCGVEWIAVGSNAFNEAVPFYAHVDATPAYLANTGKNADTNSFYWANRLIGALADAHYAACISPVERYQLKLASEGHRLLEAFDAGFQAATPEEARAYLTACNQQMADRAQELTTDVLNKVLFAASNEMKNAFARSDA